MAETKIVGVIPILPSSDVERSVAFYVERLGFTVLSEYGEPPFYALVQRGPMELHISLVEDISIALQVQIRFLVENVGPIFEEFRTAGAPIVQGLEAKPWGTREFAVHDPDGVCIVVFERAG